MILREKVKHKARLLSVGATVAQRTELQEQRRRLRTRINGFHRTADNFYDMLGDDLDGDEPFVADEDIADENHEDDEDPDEDEALVLQPEELQLRMPSTVMSSIADITPEFQRLVKQELDLRVGQANDALRKLRLAIGHKSLLFRTSVRKSKTNQTKTRAWSGVRGVEEKVKEHAACYRLARKALVSLGASADLLGRYKELLDEDLRVSADIVEENRVYQRNDSLPWIWRLEGQDMADGDDWMQECKMCLIDTETCILMMSLQSIESIGFVQKLVSPVGRRNKKS